ncbi:hypothetical protein HP548_11940 [Paenibacillus taichungensis]|uniref:SH3 domain-containing protein n=1 Tax=Paenibacillus taichungensis TaxID=484184 RepID=A0ABX2ML59_9BACL|nr:hypothetical protein [Paenibacillus taichungensis]NUU54789.1 hypothetical protein [Paenibacillus taichungensis]
MFKKMIAVTLVAAISLPVTGAFASEYMNNSVTPDTQNFNESRATVTKYWTVNTNANMRATPSRTGAHVLSLYPGDKLQGGSYTVVVNGETWGFFLNPNGIEAGYVLLSSLTADN